MTRALIEMDQQGKLKGDAAYIFMKTKPMEELYDLAKDPDEVQNVAQVSEYQSKLKDLRTALEDWQKKVGDLGFVPESDLVQRMWPGFIQPCTDTVRFKKNNQKLVLACKTDGASIGYQVDDEIGGRRWNLYCKPLSIKSFKKIAARAVRIGFKTSAISYFSD